MKYLDEYRDRDIVSTLTKRINSAVTKDIRLMEICGTHTMAIFRYGIRSLLSDRVELISGPGCPVCVTAMEDIDRAIELSKVPGLILTTFGDMLRVPGSESSLQRESAMGADVRVVYSTFDALDIAQQNPDREVVFLGIGFETTAPTVAGAIKVAREKNIRNFSVFSVHKLLPPAMEALISDGELKIDGFICPGHVSTIIGLSPYKEVVKRYKIPCVIVGFEPVDIMEGIFMLVDQIEGGRAEAEIQYRRVVRPEGNPEAIKIMNQIFEPCDSNWRGLGFIPESGLRIRDDYRDFDALERFEINVRDAKEPPGCRCAEVLKGILKPPECSLFRKVCSPSNPIGACMVSSEGTCSAYYKYS